ncbi:MAG: hypothetical protein ACRC5H_04500 [Treponemataceae bacterium]
MQAKQIIDTIKKTQTLSKQDAKILLSSFEFSLLFMFDYMNAGNALHNAKKILHW